MRYQWLEKQYEARKSFKIEDPDLKEHEQDPDWLADKARFLIGNNCFNNVVHQKLLKI